jgi:hypothetical protein
MVFVLECERKADAPPLPAAVSVAGNAFCQNGLIGITHATPRPNSPREAAKRRTLAVSHDNKRQSALGVFDP